MPGISDFAVNRLQHALKCTWTADLVGHPPQSMKLYYTDSGNANKWYTLDVQLTSETLPTIAIINSLDETTEYKVYLVIYAQGQIYNSPTLYATPAGLIRKPTFTTRKGDGHIQLVFNNNDVSNNLITSDLSNNSAFDGGSAITNILVSINKIDELGGVMQVLNCPVSGSLSSDSVFLFGDVNFYDSGILIIPQLENGAEYEIAVTYVNEFGPSEISETAYIVPNKLPENVDIFALNAHYLVDGKLEIGDDYPSVVVYWETPAEAYDDFENILKISKYHVYKQIADGSFNILCDVNFDGSGNFTDISSNFINDLSYNLLQNVQFNFKNGNHISITDCNRLVDLDVEKGTSYTYRVVSENKYGSSSEDNDSNQILALLKPSKIILNKTDLSFNYTKTDLSFNYTNFSLNPFSHQFIDNYNGFVEDEITRLTIEVDVNGTQQEPYDISFNDLTNLSGLIGGFSPKDFVQIKLRAVFSHDTQFYELINLELQDGIIPLLRAAPTGPIVVESSTVESDTITYTFYGELLAPTSLVSTNIDVSYNPTPGKMRLTWDLVSDTNGPDLSENLIYYELTITDSSLNTQQVKYLLSNDLNLDLSSNNFNLFRPNCLTPLPTDISCSIVDFLPFYVSDSSSAYTKFQVNDISHGYIDISCNLGHSYSYSIKTQYYNTDNNIYVLSNPTATDSSLVSFDRPLAPGISNFTTDNSGNYIRFDLDSSNNNTGLNSSILFRGFLLKNGEQIYIQDLSAGTNTINSSDLDGVLVGDLLTLQVTSYLDVENISIIQNDSTEFHSFPSNTFNYHYFEELSAPTNVVATNVNTNSVPTPGSMKLTWDLVQSTNGPTATIYYLLTVTDISDNIDISSNIVLNTNNYSSTDGIASYTFNDCTLGGQYVYTITAQYYNGDFDTNITSSAASAGDALTSFDLPSAPTISNFTTPNDGSSVTFQLDASVNNTGFSDTLILFRGEIWKNGSQFYTQDLSAGTNTIDSSYLDGVSLGDLLTLQVVSHLDDVKYKSTGETDEFDSTPSNTFNYHYFEELSAVGTLTAENVNSNYVPTPGSMKLTWPLVQSTNGPTATIYYLLTVTDISDNIDISSNIVLNTNNYSSTDGTASYTFNGCTVGKYYIYTIKAQYDNDDFDTSIYSNNTLTQNALVSFDLPKKPVITEFEVEVDGSQLSFTLTPDTNSTGFLDNLILFRADLSNSTPFSVTSGRNVIENTLNIVNKGATIYLRVTAYLASVIYNSDNSSMELALEFVNNSDATSNVRYSYRPHIKNIDISNSVVTIFAPNGDVLVQSNSVVTILVEPNGDELVQIAYLAIGVNNYIYTQFIQDIDIPNTLDAVVSYDSTSLDGTITLSFPQSINNISISAGNNNGFDFKKN